MRCRCVSKQENDWMTGDNIAVFMARAVVEAAIACGVVDRCMRWLDSMREAMSAFVVVSQAHVLNASVHLLFGN